MGLFDEVERELTRSDSAPPIEPRERGPRLIDIPSERIAIFHEFGKWTFALLYPAGEEAGSFADQRARIHTALLTIGEAERAGMEASDMGDEDRKRLNAAEQLLYHEDRKLGADYGDRQFAALLLEQQHLPWLITVHRDHDDRDEIGFHAVVWLFQGHVVASSWPGDWRDEDRGDDPDDGEDLLICRQAVAELVTKPEERYAETHKSRLTALLEQLPDVTDLPPRERAQLAAGYFWEQGNSWGPILVNNAVAPPKPRTDRPRIPEPVRSEVWRRDQGRCVECGSQERLEFDHIIPISRGGSNTPRNLQLLCEACNRRKRDRI
jgi:hypothetical protein